jgi:hypothetical protein
MPFQPQPPFPKARGDGLKSADWNDLVQEVQRLDTDKIGATGGSITGSLSISTALAVGAAAAPDVPLRVQTAGPDNAPILALSTPNNEDFVSIFGGRRANQLPFVAWKRGDLRFGLATSFAGGGFKEFLRINAADSAAARVETDGRIRSGQLTMGSWPANPTEYVFFGANTQSQTEIGNYALIQGTASDIGTTYLNSPKSVHLRINNSTKLVVQNSGNIDIVPPSVLSFGSVTRQMINLWSGGYGIGIQNSTLYFRSDSQYAWHQSGAHDDDADDPGATLTTGGRTLMLLDANGNLFIRGSLVQNNAQNRLKTRSPIIIVTPPIVVNPSDARLKQDVEPLQGALARLLRLHGVSYAWQEPAQFADQPGVQLGFIAQDVEEVFPEWVQTDEDGLKGLAMRGFEALTVESLRELHTRNQELSGQVLELTTQVQVLTTQVESLQRRCAALEA